MHIIFQRRVTSATLKHFVFYSRSLHEMLNLEDCYPFLVCLAANTELLFNALPSASFSNLLARISSLIFPSAGLVPKPSNKVAQETRRRDGHGQEAPRLGSRTDPWQPSRRDVRRGRRLRRVARRLGGGQLRTSQREASQEGTSIPQPLSAAPAKLSLRHWAAKRETVQVQYAAPLSNSNRMLTSISGWLPVRDMNGANQNRTLLCLSVSVMPR